MMLDLTDRQRTLLGEVLDSELKGLLDEIAHTDTREYRDQLKARHTELASMLRRIRA